MNIVMDYNVSTDGAPLAVTPLGDGTGDWGVYCRCCLRTFTENDRAGALMLAQIHTYLGETFDCAAGQAAAIRQVRRLEHASECH